MLFIIRCGVVAVGIGFAFLSGIAYDGVRCLN